MGRSYVQKGVSISVPRHGFTPRGGDKFYIQGKLVTLKSVRDDYAYLRGSIDGMNAMSVSNLYQVARVPEGSRFGPYGTRTENPKRCTSSRRTTAKSSTLLPAKVRINPKTGKIQVFVSPQVAARVNPAKVKAKTHKSGAYVGPL